MKKNLVILASALVLLVSSCKKDEEPPAVEVTAQNLAGAYKMSKIGVKVNNSAEEDVTRFLVDSCEMDDLLTFNSNLSYTYVDAGTTCDSSTSGSGTWSLKDNATMIISDSTYGIRRFDGTNLELNDTDVVRNVTAIYTMYYVKQ